MKPSFYNIFFDVDKKHYVYNTLTSGLISLTEDILRSLQDENLNNISSQVVDVLAEQGFVTSKSMDELSCYKYYYNKLQYQQPDTIRFVFVPTYGCNLDCSYCYQGKIKDPKQLDKSQISSLKLFVLNEIKRNNNIRKIQLGFYGGEPLLCKRANIEIANYVRELANELNLKIETNITTNAVLIDSDIIENFIIPNDMKIQITIDGVKSTNDTRRVSKNNKSSFDSIKSSIMLLNYYGLKDNIILRLNVDNHNINEIDDVLREFSDLVGDFYVSPLLEAGNNTCNKDTCISKSTFFAKYYNEIECKLKALNINKEYKHTFGKKKPCAINKENGYFIDCNLDVYKCVGFVGEKHFAVGQISDNGVLVKNSNYYKQLTWSPFNFSKCVNCNLLPACASGCAYDAYLNNGSINHNYCEIQQDSLIRELTDYVKRIYKQA